MLAPLKRALLALAAAPLLSACGIAFLSDSQGTELFKELRLEGNFIVNSEVIVTTEVSSTYPVPLRIACYYDGRDLTEDEEKIAFHERALLIGERVLEPVRGGQPDEEEGRETLTMSFSVPEPGDYFLACLTPAAPENGIGEEFTIRAVADASARAAR